MGTTKPLFAGLESSVLVQRWRGMPPRDRLALGLLGGFLLLVLLYLMVWRPAQQGAVQARDYYQQERELNAYLQANAGRAKGLQNAPQETVDASRLQGFVTRSAAEYGMTIERLDNQGAGGLQVNLQPVAFADLLRWFVELEANGVRVDEAGLDRAEQGRVTARLTLRTEG